MSTCKNKITMKKENDLARKANLLTESTNTTDIENMIFNIRGQQVMLDRDLAKLYGVETKVLNQAVKRNLERFPERFRFQLTVTETDKLVTICDRLQNLKHSTVCPFVFTEQGVAMLSSVLRSQTAAEVSVEEYANAHDRFLCIDNQVYHIGASLKDLGKKWFAFSKMEIETDHLVLKVHQT